MNCIYCKQKIITGSNNSVEHVFPDSFGCPDDWTLDCVCRKCNNTLGGTIERWIAGESPEAMLRLAYIGSKSGKPIKQLRLQINIPNKLEFADFQGVRLEIDFKIGELLLPTQIGLKNNSGIYEYFTNKQLGDQKTLDRINNILSHKDIKWLASGDKNIFNKKIKEFQSVLEKKGINLPKGAKKEFNLPKNSIQNGKIPVNIHSLIDEDIQRAIVKIAFNYLAKIKGGDYVLKNCFDDIREFKKVIISKILAIEPNEWLVPIKNEYPALEAEYLRLEPTKMPMDKAKIEALTSVRAH